MGTTGVQSFLMLAVDLPAFCDCMQWVFFAMPTPAEWYCLRKELPLAHATQMMGDHMVPHNFVVRTKLQLRPTAAGAMTRDMETKLLLPFKRMVTGRQKVTVLNSIRPTSSTTALKLHMGPHFVYTKAVAWRLLEVTEALKHTNDKLIASGDLALAAEKHEHMAHVFTRCMIFQLPPECYSIDNELPIGLAVRTIMDAVATAGFLHLKLGNIPKSKNCLAMLGLMPDFMNLLPDHAQVLWQTMVVLSRVARL